MESSLREAGRGRYGRFSRRAGLSTIIVRMSSALIPCSIQEVVLPAGALANDVTARAASRKALYVGLRGRGIVRLDIVRDESAQRLKAVIAGSVTLSDSGGPHSSPLLSALFDLMRTARGKPCMPLRWEAQSTGSVPTSNPISKSNLTFRAGDPWTRSIEARPPEVRSG